jgi:hypothetical protein
MNKKNRVPRNVAMCRAFLSVILAGTFASPAFPACSATGCWGVYIEELYPEAQGGAWIRTSGDESLANCTADSNIYLRLSGTTPGYKEIYATLLAAQLAEKRVSIRIAEGTNPCTVAYVTLNSTAW